MKETQDIEFKRQWRDDFLAELCGFANAQGGTLYIGVDDKGSVVGIENAKQLLEKLPNLINQTMGVVGHHQPADRRREGISLRQCFRYRTACFLSRQILLPFGHYVTGNERQRFAKFFVAKDKFVVGRCDSAKRDHRRY